LFLTRKARTTLLSEIERFSAILLADNTAIGVSALALDAQGNTNVAMPRNTLFLKHRKAATTRPSEPLRLQNNTRGDGKTAVGNGALANIMTGFGNIALGLTAGLKPASTS